MDVPHLPTIPTTTTKKSYQKGHVRSNSKIQSSLPFNVLDLKTGSSINDVTHLFDIFWHPIQPLSSFLVQRLMYCPHQVVNPLPLRAWHSYGRTLSTKKCTKNLLDNILHERRENKSKAILYPSPLLNILKYLIKIDVHNFVKEKNVRI